MAKGVIDADGILNRERPWVHQQAHEIQPFEHLVKLPIRSSSLQRPERSPRHHASHRSRLHHDRRGPRAVSVDVGGVDTSCR